MTDFRPATAGDLEAVILAESFDLLSSTVGSYMYGVSGDRPQQQIVFRSSEVEALYFVRVNEFLAIERGVTDGARGLPKDISLFEGGRWLAERYPGATVMRKAYARANTFFSDAHRLVFWAPSVSRHLRLELSMTEMIGMKANFEKHQLLKLTRTVRRLRDRCVEAGCHVTTNEALSVRRDFYSYLDGMLAYHGTGVAEHIGGCLLGLHDLASQLYHQSPTNNLDVAKYPSDVSDDVFRYMYTGTVFQLAGWTEERILSSTPETGSSFKHPYQHTAWDLADCAR